MTNDAPKPHPHLDRILKAIDYINAHAADDLSLDQIADIAALSRFHWQRVFSAVMGASPAQIIRSVRMHKAAGLLLSTDQPVCEIASQVGYASERSFVRVFKDASGQTPTAFRLTGKKETVLYPSPQATSSVFDVEVKTISDKRLAALAHRGDYSEASGAYLKVAAIISARGHWPKTRGLAGIFYDDPGITPECDLYSYAGVLWEGQMVPDGLQEIPISGGRYAVLHFKGHYTGMDEAFRFLYGPWLTLNQEALRDVPTFSHYLNDPTNTAPTDLLTDIYMPLAA